MSAELNYSADPKGTTLSFSSRSFDCNCLGSASGLYVLKTGDSMTGKLGINIGTQAVGPGEALRLDAVFNDGGAASQNFFLATLKADTSSGNFNDFAYLQVLNSVNTQVFGIGGNGACNALGGFSTTDVLLASGSLSLGSVVSGNGTITFLGSIQVGLRIDPAAGALEIQNSGIAQKLRVYNTRTSSTNFERLDLDWTTSVCSIWTSKGSGGGTARVLRLGADGTELLRFGSATTISFFAATAVVKQTSGENLTNNVTSGGTDGTIANYTDLVVYTNDAAAIRNDIYQLARKLKQINDGLRSYGLFT